MNFQLKFCLFLFVCLNLGFKIQCLDVNENSDELEIYKQMFAKLNELLEGNNLMQKDLKGMEKRIQLIESKLNTTPGSKAFGDNKNENILDCNVKYVSPSAETSDVYCFGDNWIVIQRRTDGSENFNRDWNDYKYGFGNNSNEFFMGLEKLYQFTTSKPHELLVVMQDFDNSKRYAKYDEFEIAGETEKYALKTLGAYSGNAGDSLTYHKGSKFSTRGHDNDQHPDFNCAEKFGGAWWYKACHECNLNGCYSDANFRDSKKAMACGIQWKTFRGQWYSLKSVEVMIRPKTK